MDYVIKSRRYIRKEGKKVQRRSIYISGIWLLGQQVLKAGITDVSGIINITDIIDDADIATDIADIVNIADIADRMLRILRRK